MSFKFIQKPLTSGFYEPEGIYLDPPLESTVALVQPWGEQSDFYGQYYYNGIQLQGYIGLGFDIATDSPVFAMDQGRISEINIELGGFERYIKIDHWWGESLYARVHSIQVEAGQTVKRSTTIASASNGRGPFASRFHLGIRIRPFNRFDGWGGFSDPLPYLSPDFVRNCLQDRDISTIENAPLLPLANETSSMRRP